MVDMLAAQTRLDELTRLTPQQLAAVANAEGRSVVEEARKKYEQASKEFQKWDAHVKKYGHVHQWPKEGD